LIMVSLMKKKTQEQYVKDVKNTHGDAIEVLETYVNAVSPILLKCNSCSREWSAKAHSVIEGNGCLTCSRNRMAINKRKTPEQYALEVKLVHGDTLEVIGTYKTTIVKIEHRCTRCGHVWKAIPNSILAGVSCPPCSGVTGEGTAFKTQDKYEQDLNRVHGTSIKLLGEYKGSKIRVKHLCTKCDNIWMALPGSVLNGATCPNCYRGPINYSKKAVAWLNEEAKIRGIHIRHAENDGEYRIPETKFYVDGYHDQTKTIFEFHGDCWHGNPTRYKPNERCHPFSKLTARQLYRRTVKRESIFRELGYTVITMWESDYDKKS
jgi:predicted  nucleic acid-binding Zn-ribbon protein